MLKVLNKSEWGIVKREPYQKFLDYQKRLEFNLKNIQIGLNNLNTDFDQKLDNYYVGLMNASNAVAQLSLKSIFFSYSAGLTIKELVDYFPDVIAHWKLYAKHHINFHQSSECDGHLVPHLELVTDDYWEALQLVCFSILFAQPEHLPTIMDILAYENDEQDALLDKLVSPWLPDREISAIYLRQLPYRKLDKVFTVKEEDRPKLMSQYLDDWYGASKREPYHDRHKSSQFPGYWSLEAATVTVILRIDDRSYRDKPYYPKDLVDYARSQYLP